MRNRFNLLSIALIVLISLWAFGAVAQDATSTPVDGNTNANTNDNAATPADANTNDNAAQQPVDIMFGSASVIDMTGQNVGGVVFVAREDGKLIVTANLVNLPPGWHAFHLHEHGSCDADMLTAPGPHLNLTGAAHPDHSGDFPSLLVAADGTAFLSFATDRIVLSDLFPAAGAAVMIHAHAENFANIPPRYGAAAGEATPDPAMGPVTIADAETLNAGDPGEPIACGVVEQGFMAVIPSITATPDGGEAPAPTLEATVDLTLSPELTLTVDTTLSPDVTVTVDTPATLEITPDLTLSAVRTLTPDMSATVDLTPTVETTATSDDMTPVETIEGTDIPLDPTPTSPPA